MVDSLDDQMVASQEVGSALTRGNLEEEFDVEEELDKLTVLPSVPLKQKAPRVMLTE